MTHRSYLFVTALLSAATAFGQDATMSGGDTTVTVNNRYAYSKSAANLPLEALREFEFGNRLFNTNWVIAPASVERFDGLGPLFNRVSCSGCHVRDGRGRPPDGPDEPMMSMLVRISVNDRDKYGDPMPHPVYGGQLQDRAIPGVIPEGRCRITYTQQAGAFPDGEPYTLRAPRYELVDLGYGSISPGVYLSPRVAPAVFGLGLLEAISDETIVRMADPNDRDGNGISGIVSRVYDKTAGSAAIGRFGWKAQQPTIRQQSAAAFNGDLGITNTLYPREQQSSTQGIEAPNGGDPEIDDGDLDKLEFYLRTIAVPARRDTDDPQVQRGERLFATIGCADCHVPKITTRDDAALPQLASQSVQPFTDLLLHDMGEGLSDGRLDDGREWRTPPLWGIGLLQEVNGHTYLLHDGRARNLQEAILWHGGEGDASREAYMLLKHDDRAALLRFLGSL